MSKLRLLGNEKIEDIEDGGQGTSAQDLRTLSRPGASKEEYSPERCTR
jgi:hypothetical protein